jgi:hypothetical protein
MTAHDVILRPKAEESLLKRSFTRPFQGLVQDDDETEKALSKGRGYSLDGLAYRWYILCAT